MHADDLLLLSISITHLQSLINICCSELLDCGLAINCNKTACIRLGPRHNITQCDIEINNAKITWKNKMKYLGVVFSSGTKFSFNVHLAKQKFFRSVNAIFGKIGTQRNSGVVLSLINSFCIPVLLYGLEAFSLKQSNVNKINSLLNTVYSKMFNVRDN